MGGVSPNPSNRACPLLLRQSGLCLASSAMTAVLSFGIRTAILGVPVVIPRSLLSSSSSPPPSSSTSLGKKKGPAPSPFFLPTYLLPALFLSSPTVSAAHRRCPLPPPATSIPLLPVAAVGHHIPISHAAAAAPNVYAPAASSHRPSLSFLDHAQPPLTALVIATQPLPPLLCNSRSQPLPSPNLPSSSPRQYTTLAAAAFLSSLCHCAPHADTTTSSLPTLGHRPAAAASRCPATSPLPVSPTAAVSPPCHCHRSSLPTLLFLSSSSSSLSDSRCYLPSQSQSPPLCSARTFLPLPLQPPQPPPRSRPPLPPRPPLFLPSAPHDTTASSLAAAALAVATAFKCAPALLSSSIAAASNSSSPAATSAAALAARQPLAASSRANSLCSNQRESKITTANNHRMERLPHKTSMTATPKGRPIAYTKWRPYLIDQKIVTRGKYPGSKYPRISMLLSLEDKADLKRTGLLGP
ncbi:hypothetical protein B296_00011230 [Ensete ventricosum]|uniref:Uncharacterized protein n=1 Tax=Ensete ventricosum TaxID=4639 RepID=A0A427A2Z6_ENSVE|nr:hypothetical protein B296_00011230 [Ensete ventricosum]